MPHLKAVPFTQKQANEYVGQLHRHHKPTWGDKFRLAVEYEGRICGVVQVGRPVARFLDDGKTLEITRCCTDGTHNACSFLYGRAAAVAKLLGYSKIITYTLESENGSSLLASGFTLEGLTNGGEWDRPNRARRKADNPCRKKRWGKTLI